MKPPCGGFYLHLSSLLSSSFKFQYRNFTSHPGSSNIYSNDLMSWFQLLFLGTSKDLQHGSNRDVSILVTLWYFFCNIKKVHMKRPCERQTHIGLGSPSPLSLYIIIITMYIP